MQKQRFSMTCEGLHRQLDEDAQQIAEIVLDVASIDANHLAAMKRYWSVARMVISSSIETAINDVNEDWTILPALVWFRHDIEDLLQTITFVVECMAS